MCGICGFVGRAEETLVRAMIDALAHRGPDGEGICLFPSVDGSDQVSAMPVGLSRWRPRSRCTSSDPMLCRRSGGEPTVGATR
jgi:asparagine synthetase B (glutamine-hydrolysing)